MHWKPFRGGIHPDPAKRTAGLAIELVPLPGRVVIPLQQHIGAPCKPLVQPGDEVLTGQVIGEPGGFVSAPVHASLSGKVAAVAPMSIHTGQEVMSVVIDSDGRDQMHPDLKAHHKWEQASSKEIVDWIRECGLVGMGGAGFPTHVKFAPPADKPIEAVILNGAECEPYLTCDHRVMQERADKVVLGLRAFMKAVSAPIGYIAVEDNKEEAIDRLTRIVASLPQIKVVPLRTRYPQGEERLIIKSVLNREVPRGGLPADVGAIVSNVSTAAAFADFLLTGRPLIQRIVTITGSGIVNPKNLEVRIGTLLEHVIRSCGGLKDNAAKLIVGGPMTGPSYYDLAVPVTKTTAGLVVLNDAEARQLEPIACVSCGKCVEACPYGLLPNLLGKYAETGRIADAEKIGLMDCRECGCCSYICPSRRPLLQAIKSAKAVIAARRKKG
jgi:electron transport complex protein RnfC